MTFELFSTKTPLRILTRLFLLLKMESGMKISILLRFGGNALFKLPCYNVSINFIFIVLLNFTVIMRITIKLGSFN